MLLHVRTEDVGLESFRDFERIHCFGRELFDRVSYSHSAQIQQRVRRLGSSEDDLLNVLGERHTGNCGGVELLSDREHQIQDLNLAIFHNIELYHATVRSKIEAP